MTASEMKGPSTMAAVPADSRHNVMVEFEGSFAEVTIERDWEGFLQMEVTGSTGRAHTSVDVPSLEVLRDFLNDVITKETPR